MKGTSSRSPEESFKMLNKHRQQVLKGCTHHPQTSIIDGLIFNFCINGKSRNTEN